MNNEDRIIGQNLLIVDGKVVEVTDIVKETPKTDDTVSKIDELKERQKNKLYVSKD